MNEFGCIEWPKLELVQLDIEQPLGHHSLLPGSVLICLRGSLRVCRIPNRIPQLGPPAGDPVPILASTAWAVIEPNPDEVTSEYLEWILNRPSVLKQLADRRKGSTVQFIPIKQLADIELPVPDLTTQREIVKTASDLDEARISGTSQHSRASIGHRMMPTREMLDSSWQSAVESRWSQLKSWERPAQDPATPPPSSDLGEGTALRSVLDHYGLLHRVDFRGRDAVMRLPDGRCILIDCSAPIDAMLAEADQLKLPRQHYPLSKQGSTFYRYIENLARRVDDEGGVSIAWTVVYVPNAALLSRALTQDPQIQLGAVRNLISLTDKHTLGPALSQALTLASRPVTQEPAVRWPPPRR
ncbi:MAG: restriction endonuclease subunit S [Planctomycetota bacterium]|nr:restriction endonuclease subunit S [Planctomycetota bacterium]